MSCAKLDTSLFFWWTFKLDTWQLLKNFSLYESGGHGIFIWLEWAQFWLGHLCFFLGGGGGLNQSLVKCERFHLDGINLGGGGQICENVNSLPTLFGGLQIKTPSQKRVQSCAILLTHLNNFLNNLRGSVNWCGWNYSTW